MTTPGYRSICALTLGLCLFASSPASAQTADQQAALNAQALYDQAFAEMGKKQYASACRKLEEAVRLVPQGTGARKTLGECYEKLGKLASAWSTYAILKPMADKSGQTERSHFAAERAAALQPRLATLAIEVPLSIRTLTGLKVVRDGIEIGEPQWGSPMPVDTGGHEVLVSAPGYKTWSKEVEVVADGAKLSVKVPELEPDKETPKPLAPTATAAPALPTVPPAPDWQKPVGLSAMAFGGIGLSAGAILGILAVSRKNASNQEGRCDPTTNICNDEGLALRSEAVGLGNGSTVAFVIGAATLAGGTVLYLTAPRKQQDSKAKSTQPNAQVSLGPGGVTVRGVW